MVGSVLEVLTLRKSQLLFLVLMGPFQICKRFFDLIRLLKPERKRLPTGPSPRRMVVDARPLSVTEEVWEVLGSVVVRDGLRVTMVRSAKEEGVGGQRSINLHTRESDEPSVDT